jgi:hypothetical protein
MGVLTEKVLERTLRKVHVVYVGREDSKAWNARRKTGEVAVLCGHYWYRGDAEFGPFKSYSAAVRDAYYQAVLGREPPRVNDRATVTQRNKSVAAAQTLMLQS